MPEVTETRGCPKPEGDIVFNPLPKLPWEKTEAGESARKLADYVACEAQLAIQWYLYRKRLKKNWAQSLRVVAIIATALAGLIPLLSEVLGDWLPAIWGSVALIIAATAVALDRFFGFSSAWMRFLTTEMQIRHTLHRFLFDWEAKQAKLAGSTPDEGTVQALVPYWLAIPPLLTRASSNPNNSWPAATIAHHTGSPGLLSGISYSQIVGI